MGQFVRDEFDRMTAERVGDYTRAPSRHTPITVQAGVEIRIGGDIWIDAIGTYAANGTLLTVEINGDDLTPDGVETAFSAFGKPNDGWDDDLADDRLDALLEEGARDHAEGEADYRRDLRNDL